MSESKDATGKKRQRRQFSPEDKATILRRHLVDHVPVSDLCDEYKIQPTLFYLWQRQAFEHLSAALQDGRTTRGQQQTAATARARVDALEAKLAKKDAVIAFIASEHLALKKTLGES
jgi:transposase-like protein